MRARARGRGSRVQAARPRRSPLRSVARGAQDDPCGELVGGAELERRSRLQRSSSRRTGSPRSSSRRRSGAVTITLRNCTSVRGGPRPRPGARPATVVALPVARPSGERERFARRAARAARTASSGSSLPRSRCSSRGPRPISSTGFALAAQVAGQAGAVVTSTFVAQAGAPGAYRSSRHSTSRLPACSLPRPVGDHTAAGAATPRGCAVAVGVDADRVVQFVCKHPFDPPTRS